MKLEKQIFRKDDSVNLFKVDIYYNQKIGNGLYLVGDDTFIKRNVKNLGITYQVPDTHEQIGVRYSKQYDFVVVTLVLIAENGKKTYFQFILTKECSPEVIYGNTHYVLEKLREILIDGLKMLYVNTMQDLLEYAKENSGK